MDTSATKSELQELKASGIQGVIIPGPLDTYAPINDSTDLIDFLKRAKEADVNVIVELKPGSSKKWFDDFAYFDYYIWAKSKSEGEYPNNWVSLFKIARLTIFYAIYIIDSCHMLCI